MWSGPRNISTALMRAWENRPDTAVWDEPFYAHYLLRTGVAHPGRDEVIAACETDPAAVVRGIVGPIPNGADIHYQKHMAHHMLPELGRGWLGGFRQAFLIREPREMLLSLDKVTPDPRLEDTGLPQQVELFEEARAALGATPPVIDSRDVLEAPEPMLRALCAAVGVEFTPVMLHWPAGRRDTDGVWAPHWYASVEASTGFAPYVERDERLPARLEPLLEECLPFHRALHEVRLRP